MSRKGRSGICKTCGDAFRVHRRVLPENCPSCWAKIKRLRENTKGAAK